MIDAIRKMGVPVISFRLPIEVQLLQDGIPSELASFFCSALDNCQMIFGDKLSIKAFRIQQGKFFAGCGLYRTFTIISLRKLACILKLYICEDEC